MFRSVLPNNTAMLELQRERTAGRGREGLRARSFSYQTGPLDTEKNGIKGAWFGPNYCLFYFVFFISAVIVWKSLFLNIIRFTD